MCLGEHLAQLLALSGRQTSRMSKYHIGVWRGIKEVEIEFVW
jgi:hypothetical protein